jgi:hypothetical protein
MPAPDSVTDRYGPQGGSAPPPAPPPYYPPYAPPSRYVPRRRTSAAPSGPHTSASRLSQVADLVNSWLQFVGYSIDVTPDMNQKLADAGVQTLWDLGQWMLSHGQGQIQNSYPWAAYGFSHEQYSQRMAGFQAVYEDLTGESNVPHGWIESVMQTTKGQATAAEFRQSLLVQPDFSNQYGWVKFGLNYQQFQEQKIRMDLAFGKTLSNQDAVVQLKYFHAAQGPNMAASVGPTISGQEKKQAQVGLQGNVVR